MAIKLFSYNLSQSEYLRKTFIQFLSGKDNTIVFLQECPKFKSTNTNHFSGFKEFTTQGSAGNLVILISNDLYKNRKNIQILAQKQFFQKIIFDGIDLINVHMKSTIEDKLAHDKYIDQVKEIRKAMGNRAIIGGDFNANPFDYEMTSTRGWFAKRTFSEITGNQIGFINLFWKPIARKASSKPIGTIVAHYEKPMSMAIFDQFIIDPDLYNNVKSFGIINHIKNLSISTLNENAKNQSRKRNKGKNDRHWPIYLSIKI